MGPDRRYHPPVWSSGKKGRRERIVGYGILAAIWIGGAIYLIWFAP